MSPIEPNRLCRGDQRYYASASARFLTPDPSMDGVDFTDPGSWNAYSYAGNDPVNFSDPSGLTACGDMGVEGGGTVRDAVLADTAQGHYIDLVWHEGGTLSQAKGDFFTWVSGFDLIAQAIWNRLQIVSGRVSVTGANGMVYAARNAKDLGYLRPGQRPDLNNVLIQAAAGTGVLTSTGQLQDTKVGNLSGLKSDLNQDQGDFSYSAKAGRTIALVTSAGQITVYVTSDCASVIEAMWAANSVVAGTIDLNTSTFFPTSWNSSAPINNPNYAAGVEALLGSAGRTNFFGFTAWGYAPPPVRAPRR